MKNHSGAFGGLLLVAAILPGPVLAQTQSSPGQLLFESNCAICHGKDAKGGELGPAITARISNYTLSEMESLVREGLPGSGMPSHNLAGADMQALVAYVQTLKGDVDPQKHRTVSLPGGKSLTGTVLNEGPDDLQLLGDDDRTIHLLRKTATGYRPVTSQVDWTSYDGGTSGNRYTALKQITPANVAHMAPQWIFPLRGASPLEGTPLVVGGLMYMTSANEIYALDAGSGRQVWHYQRKRTKDVIGNAAGGINRGAAVAGDKIFLGTDNCHLIALNRFTGKLLWDTEMEDSRQNYGSTGAPLTVGNLVVSGSSGGDEGVRGFIAAFDQTTGKEVWRFWTVPKPGEPGSETWQGDGINHPAVSTWLSGSYDPSLDTIYWSTGNPGADLDGDNRGGDNLYASSVVALDAKTGKMKWYFQFTPHNLWDYDAEQPLALVDANWEGKPRKLLLDANRNGYFYVLDRTDGKLLLAKKFVRKMTWSTGLDAKGRPIVAPNTAPTLEGNTVCPSLQGGSNWFSTAFNPATGLYYVQTLEKCSLFTKTPMQWTAGKGYFGGTFGNAPGDVPQKIIRGIDIKTGAVKWELPQTGPGSTSAGTLATAGGLVFFGDDAQGLTAADARTGKALWHFPMHQNLRASPMTYEFDGKQYVAIASGSDVIAFGVVK